MNELYKSLLALCLFVVIFFYYLNEVTHLQQEMHMWVGLFYNRNGTDAMSQLLTSAIRAGWFLFATDPTDATTVYVLFVLFLDEHECEQKCMPFPIPLQVILDRKQVYIHRMCSCLCENVVGTMFAILIVFAQTFEYQKSGKALNKMCSHIHGECVFCVWIWM